MRTLTHTYTHMLSDSLSHTYEPYIIKIDFLPIELAET